MENLIKFLGRNVKVCPENGTNHRIGYTDYIDRFEPEDVGDAILTGADSYGREYIAFNVYDEGGAIVAVVFRRYRDETMWVCSELGLDAQNIEEMEIKIIDKLDPNRPREELERVIYPQPIG